jgi:hypothetical protein
VSRAAVSAWTLGLALLIAATVTGRAGAALSPDQQLAVAEEAARAYDEGIAVLRRDPEQARRLFRESAERFQVLVDEGVENGRLRFNLANAWLQAGELGRAIVEYRRAAALTPGDARLRANLEHARSLGRTRLAPSGRRALGEALLFWHHRTSLSARRTVFVMLYLAFWALLLLRPWRRVPLLLPAAGVLAAGWLAVGISIATDARDAGRPTAGVIMRDDVVVRRGNGVGYEPRFEEPLHEGVEFELREERGAWLFIELVDGQTGWIPAAAAELI